MMATDLMATPRARRCHGTAAASPPGRHRRGHMAGGPRCGRSRGAAAPPSKIGVGWTPLEKEEFLFTLSLPTFLDVLKHYQKFSSVFGISVLFVRSHRIRCSGN